MFRQRSPLANRQSLLRNGQSVAGKTRSGRNGIQFRVLVGNVTLAITSPLPSGLRRVSE